MTTSTIILVGALLIVLAAMACILYRQQRRKALRARFGPEYSQAVRQYGNESRAADALAARERRMEKIHIRSLAHEDHQRFIDQWQTVQRDFVDDPDASIERANALVCDVMRTRGYPMSDCEHHSEDISVDHPHVVQNRSGLPVSASHSFPARICPQDFNPEAAWHRGRNISSPEHNRTDKVRRLHHNSILENEVPFRMLQKLVEDYALRSREYSETVARLGSCRDSGPAFLGILDETRQRRTLCDAVADELNGYVDSCACGTA